MLDIIAQLLSFLTNPYIVWILGISVFVALVLLEKESILFFKEKVKALSLTGLCEEYLPSQPMTGFRDRTPNGKRKPAYSSDFGSVFLINYSRMFPFKPPVNSYADEEPIERIEGRRLYE